MLREPRRRGNLGAAGERRYWTYWDVETLGGQKRFADEIGVNYDNFDQAVAFAIKRRFGISLDFLSPVASLIPMRTGGYQPTGELEPGRVSAARREVPRTRAQGLMG